MSRTDPDARLATSGGRRGFEPSYKQHAVVDDARGVVLDVSVTAGTVNEREMLESQVEAVRELSGRDPALVTADSGYAYSKVYAALVGRADSVEEGTLAKPCSVALFRYDARNDIVKCPRGTLPRRSEERGRYYGSKTRDCAGCALRVDCLPKARSSKEVLIPHAYPALLRARRRHARWGEEERRMWRRHMWRSEGYHGEAKTWHGLARAVRRGLDIPVLPDGGGVNLRALSAALAANHSPLEGLGRPRILTRPSRSQTRNGLRVRRRVNLHTARNLNGVIQQPLEGESQKPSPLGEG